MSYQIYLDPSLHGELKTRWPEWAEGTARRASAARKKLIYTGQHKDLITAHIEERIPEPDTCYQVVKFTSRSPNLLRAVGDAVPVVYGRGGCRRSLRGPGVTELAAKAFATLVAESGIAKRANGINGMSWILGTTVVAPLIDKRNLLALDILTPDTVELRRSGEYIESALWKVGKTYVELDDVAWRYYDESGREYRDPILHFAGVCPAVPFMSRDNTIDFWAPTETDGLADATLDIAYKLAYGLWVRQVSGNNLTVVRGNIDDVPAGQSAGEVGGVLYLNGDKNSTAVDVHNRIVPAKDHLEEIAAIMALAVSQFGIPPGSIGMTSNSSMDLGTLAISVEGDRLGALRDKQVQWLLAAERELWPVVCDFVRGSTHKLAKVIPPGDEVREMLRISFADLASAADQKARIEAMAAGLPYGITNPRDYLAAARPERTEAEIEEEMAANMETYIKTIKPLVERNTPADASGLDKGYQTQSQEQGREGGISSGETRAAIAEAA